MEHFTLPAVLSPATWLQALYPQRREEIPMDGATAVFDLSALRNWLQAHRVNDPDPLTGRTVLHSAAAQVDDEHHTRTFFCVLTRSHLPLKLFIVLLWAVIFLSVIYYLKMARELRGIGAIAADESLSRRGRNTPLHYLSRLPCQKPTDGVLYCLCASTMLQRGARPDDRNEFGELPLHCAMTATPSPTVMAFLLNAGAPIHGATTRGHTCMHYAVMAGHEEAVRFLLSSGADVSARSETGTAVELASSKPSMAALLAAHLRSQHAELHASRGLLMASSGVDHSSGIEQHEDGAVGRTSSPPLSPRRPPAMRLQRDGLLRFLLPGNRAQEIFVAVFGDGVVLGFPDVGARFVLQRALDLAATTVYDAPALSDDWRHCFVIANAERSFLLLARTTAEKSEWIASLKTASIMTKQRTAKYSETALLDEAFLALRTDTRFSFAGPHGERLLLLDEISVHDIIYEIYDQRTNANAQVFLCNLLRRAMPDHVYDVIFYLPQLWYRFNQLTQRANNCSNFVVSFVTCATSEVQSFLLWGAEESRHFALMAYLFLQANPPVEALSNRHFVLLGSILRHASNVKRQRADSLSTPGADPKTMTPAALVAELHEAGVEIAAAKEPGAETVELADMVRALRLRKNAVGLADTHRAVAVAAVQKKAFQLFQAEIDFLASLNKIGEVLQGFEPEKRKEALKKELTTLGALFPSHLYMPFFPDSNIQAIPPEEIHAPYLINIVFLQSDSRNRGTSLSGPSPPRSPPGSPLARSMNDEDKEVMAGVTERSAMAAMNMEPPTPRAAEPEQLSADGIGLQAALAGSSSRFDELPREGFSAIFGEGWTEKVKRLRAASPWGELPEWHLASVIVKTGDCLTQEQFAMQLISAMNDIFLGAGLPLKLRTYRIVATDPSSGLIETVPDAVSIHGLKKTLMSRGLRTHLGFHFKNLYSTPELAKTALSNFIESLAAYSLASYVLQIKDRHNGNILLDSKGHVIHIDFGFILGQSPGNMNFETAPFKLTQEMVDLMGGRASNGWAYYVALCVKGFRVLRMEARRLECLIRMLVPGVGQRLPCFQQPGVNVVDAMMKRLHLELGNKQLVECVMDLIEQSFQNYRTRQYDIYQKLTNGLLY